MIGAIGTSVSTTTPTRITTITDTTTSIIQTITLVKLTTKETGIAFILDQIMSTAKVIQLQQAETPTTGTPTQATEEVARILNLGTIQMQEVKLLQQTEATQTTIPEVQILFLIVEAPAIRNPKTIALPILDTQHLLEPKHTPTKRRQTPQKKERLLNPRIVQEKQPKVTRHRAEAPLILATVVLPIQRTAHRAEAPLLQATVHQVEALAEVTTLVLQEVVLLQDHHQEGDK